jgi:hypothetical protein
LKEKEVLKKGMRVEIGGGRRKYAMQSSTAIADPSIDTIGTTADPMKLSPQRNPETVAVSSFLPSWSLSQS